MKVLHVLSSLNVGGAERFSIDMASVQQRKQGLVVDILSMGKQGEPLEHEVAAQKLQLTITSKLSKLRSLFKSVDVLHVHSLHCLLRVLIASCGLKVKIIFTHHNEQVNIATKWKLIYRFAASRVDKMIFVVKSAETKFVAAYPMFKSKSLTIPNGVLERKLSKSVSSKFRLGLVGRFAPLKAQHLLIEAVSLLSKEQQQQVSISFFGTGELLNVNRNLSRKHIPNVEVKFNQFVIDRDEIYTNIDCLIVTSETEGLSLAILEAIASGTPIIATNVGGNSELVTHNQNGLLYEYPDVSKLAENITIFLEDIDKYQACKNYNLINYKLKHSRS